MGSIESIGRMDESIVAYPDILGEGGSFAHAIRLAPENLFLKREQSVIVATRR
jgi:hypothetical protein